MAADTTPNELLRAARERLPSPSGAPAPMSRRELAEVVNTYLWEKEGIQENLDQDDIGKMENGRVRWPREQRRLGLRAVLGVRTDTELGFYFHRQSAEQTERHLSSPEAPTQDGGERGGVITEFAGGLWETSELVERIRAADVTLPTVEALHVTVFELCCGYGWRDARQLRSEGLGWLREIEGLLRRPVGLRQHQELLTVAGWLALLVGCVEYDMGLPAATEATRRAALQLATEGGNTEIAAWAWEMSAWYALTQGRYHDVVEAAAAGQLVVGDHTAAVQLVAQEAKARARMSDTRGVHEALQRGRRLLDRHPPPSRPDHHFVVDPAKWDFYAMDAYRLVGEDDLALHHAQEVLRLGTGADGTERAPMRMAEARLTIGAVTARSGELEQAVDIALAAFRARRRSLPQLLMIAREVGRELQSRDPRSRWVREYTEAMRAVSDQ